MNARKPTPLHPPTAVEGESYFLTPKQVAFELQVSHTEVYRLMSDHGLPNVKIGGCRRVPRAEFWRWVWTWR